MIIDNKIKTKVKDIVDTNAINMNIADMLTAAFSYTDIFNFRFDFIINNHLLYFSKNIFDTLFYFVTNKRISTCIPRIFNFVETICPFIYGV